MIFLLKINKKKTMVIHFDKIPRKVLLYFIKKNPNFQSIKNKSHDELVNIILENDILCHWTYDSYNECSKQFLKSLCEEKENFHKGVLKNKETMISFLLDKQDDDIIPKIQECLKQKEDIFLSDKEINDYL